MLDMIDYLGISWQFRGYLEAIRNSKATDIGNLGYHYQMVAMLRLRTAAIKQRAEMNRRAPAYFTRPLIRCNSGTVQQKC